MNIMVVSPSEGQRPCRTTNPRSALKIAISKSPLRRKAFSYPMLCTCPQTRQASASRTASRACISRNTAAPSMSPLQALPLRQLIGSSKLSPIYSNNKRSRQPPLHSLPPMPNVSSPRPSTILDTRTTTTASRIGPICERDERIERKRTRGRKGRTDKGCQVRSANGLALYQEATSGDPQKLRRESVLLQ